MRTYKEAKAMAKSLRDALAAKSILLSHSNCLEIVAKQWGFADWNTLSAKLDVESGHLSAHHMSRIATHEQMSCSFCDKAKHEVRSLIEGGCRNPALPQCIFICDECVEFCAHVNSDLLGSPTPQNRSHDQK